MSNERELNKFVLSCETPPGFFCNLVARVVLPLVIFEAVIDTGNYSHWSQDTAQAKIRGKQAF